MRVAVAVLAALVASPVHAGGCDELCRDRRAATNAEIAEFSADLRQMEANRRLRGIEDEIRKLRQDAETQRIDDEWWRGFDERKRRR
jgi:hypothetical protein